MTKSILVCEDDLALLSVLAEIMSSAGYLVETARDGIEAISKVIRSQPNYYDLILVDHMMPGLNGLGLVRELRHSDIPSKIIVLSGTLCDDLEAAFKEMGVEKILSKPNGIMEVAESVKAVLAG